jgi:hypothetical protein
VGSGTQSGSFRAESPGEFERALIDWSRGLPPPKSVVVIQFTWGDATATAREAARLGLIRALDRLRTERSGRAVFEVLSLGFQAQGP